MLEEANNQPYSARTCAVIRQIDKVKSYCKRTCPNGSENGQCPCDSPNECIAEWYKMRSVLYHLTGKFI